MKKVLYAKKSKLSKKNWSSVILWNCSHPKNKILTPEYIERNDGVFLHRFKWLKDNEIGDLDKKWNRLAIEYEDINDPNLIHYTLGAPCFKEYKNTIFSNYWMNAYERLKQGFN